MNPGGAAPDFGAAFFVLCGVEWALHGVEWSSIGRMVVEWPNGRLNGLCVRIRLCDLRFLSVRAMLFFGKSTDRSSAEPSNYRYYFFRGKETYR